jgi:hypothetical protein
VVAVHFQSERLGWHTDDFLVVGENGAGVRRKLAGQVKRSFTVSSRDEDCRKAITDYWRDFKNENLFSPETDRFALVTLRGTNTLLENLSSLLDCARATREGAEFEQRLRTVGLLNAAAVKYEGEIRAIVSQCEGKDLSEADLWPFLRVLHVLSLDLNSATRQTEASIKSLLAHTATEHDRVGAAEATWNALLAEMGKAMPDGRSYERTDLPEAVRARHSCIESHDHRALGALKDHSYFVFRQIRSTVGAHLHLTRVKLVGSIVDQLEQSQVVLVSGPAGSGKSGAAKSAAESLARDHFVFGFRAEEFERASLDETLHLSQIPASARALGAVLAGQDRKLLLVESIERLLEASTRDAFADLLTLLTEDRSWRLLLTCRDYSTDLVRSSFFESAEVCHAVIVVPPLDDSELEAIEAAYPGLARPLSNPPLRRLLRNPYVVDKALLISWPEDKPLPETEREFRELFWRDVIRMESRAADGMPTRRERAFVDVSLRRARTLSLFGQCGDLDPAVLDALRFDSLIVCSEESTQQFAPAHDVLEDWAILHWIGGQHALLDGSVPAFSAAIEPYPAIRRSYRKWVGELVERDPGAADRLFLAALDRTSLSNHYCDDTLVAFLRSQRAATFLERHHEALFAEGKELLRRVIHLLRVACVTAPSWLSGSPHTATLFTVPDGPAWAAVLRLVHARIKSFGHDDRLLLLALIEDWARGVWWRDPYPDGAADVVAIAYELLSGFDGYRSDDQRKRVLMVLAKLPNVDQSRFEALLLGGDAGVGGELAEDFREIVLEGPEGVPACRDVPQTVVAAAKEHFFLTEEGLRERGHFGGFLAEGPFFGIRKSLGQDFFPPSAFRGPFLALLREHPKVGIDFLVALFNHSIEWYAGMEACSERVEPLSEVCLTFSDGSTRTQRCNPRLWNLYRGTSVGPYLLQCALMALEHWLFDFAEAHPDLLDSMLVSILRTSGSGTLSAVVASLATAYPHGSCEALLSLLTAPHYVLLDRTRLASEIQASSLARLVPFEDATNKIYSDERARANARPHRRSDLEAATLALQTGPLGGRVHAVIDRHLAELPPSNQQTEYHRSWRFALRRMDLRHYTIAKTIPQTTSSAQGADRNEDNTIQVMLNLNIPDPDLREMASESATNFQAMNARLILQIWGLMAFRGESDPGYDPALWRARLGEARAAQEPGQVADDYDPARGGPELIAAVCARDHWEELSDDEKEWCVSRICDEVERNGDRWGRTARVQRNSMSSDRACAMVLPSLLARSLPDETRQYVARVLAVALTHAVEEVRRYVVYGIGPHLWPADRTLALRCVNTIAVEASLAQAALDEEFTKPYSARDDLSLLEREIARRLRAQFIDPTGIPSDALLRLDPTRSVGAEAFAQILCILSEASAEPVAIEAFKRASSLLVDWWDSDDERRADRTSERNHETESAFRDLLAKFLFQAPPEEIEPILRPILLAIDSHPREVSWLVLRITGVEDRQMGTERFWELWQLFADRVQGANWLQGIDDRYAEGRHLLTVVLLGSRWRGSARHWRSLEGHAWRVHALFESLPLSAAVVEDYLKFLYQVSEQSLPSAFVRLARRLEAKSTNQLLGTKESVYMLEALLRRYVYGRPLELKKNPELRDASLWLLDALVEAGSSDAFRMRDDFVTPLARV